jgi:hypothetical protein
VQRLPSRGATFAGAGLTRQPRARPWPHRRRSARIGMTRASSRRGRPPSARWCRPGAGGGFSGPPAAGRWGPGRVV